MLLGVEATSWGAAPGNHGVSLPPSASSLQRISTSCLLSSRVTTWRRRPAPRFPGPGGKRHQANHSPASCIAPIPRPAPAPAPIPRPRPFHSFPRGRLRRAHAPCTLLENRAQGKGESRCPSSPQHYLRGLAGPPNSSPESPSMDCFSTPSVFSKFGLQADPVGLRYSRTTAGARPSLS